MLLALDTSTHLASLAICEGSEVRAEYTWDVGTNHSVELLRRLEWFIKERGVTLHQLSAVATAIGPGSFTGVRVAVTVAKTLAFSLAIPLIGISTLDILAYSQAAAAIPVCALLEAGRGEFYAALYQQVYLDESVHSRRSVENSLRDGAWIAHMLPGSGTVRQQGLYWQRQSEYRVVSVEELGQEITQPTLLCGDLSAEARRKLAEVLGPSALFVPPLACIRRAGLLAELAAQRLGYGDLDDPLTLEPLYLRRPTITVSTRQRPQLLGQQESARALPDEHIAGNVPPGVVRDGKQQYLSEDEAHPGRQRQALDAGGNGPAKDNRWIRSEKHIEGKDRLAPDGEPDQPGWLSWAPLTEMG